MLNLEELNLINNFNNKPNNKFRSQINKIEDKKSLNVQPNIGIGLNFKSFYLDYAFTDIGDASIALYSHVISLKIKLNKPKFDKSSEKL